MKVKYIGETPVQLPTIGIEVKPGDEIDVPDDFHNAQFVPSKKKGGDSVDAAKQ